MIYMFGDDQWIDFESVEMLQRVNSIEMPSPRTTNKNELETRGPGIQVKLNGRADFMLLEMDPAMIEIFLDRWSEYVISHNSHYLEAEFPPLDIPDMGDMLYECNICTSQWLPKLEDILGGSGIRCPKCGSKSVGPCGDKG